MTLFRVEPNGTSTRVASVQTGQGTASANGPRLTRAGSPWRGPWAKSRATTTRRWPRRRRGRPGRHEALQGWRGVLPGADLPTSALPDHLRGGSCRNSTKPRAAYLQRQARDHRWHGRAATDLDGHTGSGCDRRPRGERLRHLRWRRQRRDLRRQRRGLPRRRPRARTPCSARRAGTRFIGGDGKDRCEGGKGNDSAVPATS